MNLQRWQGDRHAADSSADKQDYIEFIIKSSHFKYGIYKPKEVQNPIKKRVRKHDCEPSEVYKSHI